MLSWLWKIWGCYSNCRWNMPHCHWQTLSHNHDFALKVLNSLSSHCCCCHCIVVCHIIVTSLSHCRCHQCHRNRMEKSGQRKNLSKQRALTTRRAQTDRHIRTRTDVQVQNMHRLCWQQEAEQVKGTPEEHRQMDMSGHGKYLSEWGQDGEVTVSIIESSLSLLSLLLLSRHCHCCCHVHLTLLVHMGMLDWGQVQAGHLASPVMLQPSLVSAGDEEQVECTYLLENTDGQTDRQVRTWKASLLSLSSHCHSHCHVMVVIVIALSRSLSLLSSLSSCHGCCCCCYHYCHIIAVVVVASWLLLYCGCSRHHIVTIVIIVSLLSLSLHHCCHHPCVIVVVIITSSSLHHHHVVSHRHHVMLCHCVIVITLLLLLQSSHGEHGGLRPRAGTGGSYSIAWDAAAIVGEHRWWGASGTHLLPGKHGQTDRHIALSLSSLSLHSSCA